MVEQKFSKQREAIKSYLASSKEHPTADMVYLHMKEEFPKISLGTVYRNLNLLADTGEAIRITMPNGGVRFDFCTDPHYHVLCESCGCVDDLELPQEHVEEITYLAAHHYQGVVTHHSTLFYGKCPKCCGKNS